MTNASIVTVGSQMFRFCNVVAKAVAQTISVCPSSWDNLTDTRDARASLRSRSDVLSYWVQIFASFGILGTSIGARFMVPPKEIGVLRGQILESLEIFMVAHEYAHHILRHGRLESASPESGMDQLAHQQEHEADSLAIAISQLVTGNKQHENTLMISGVGMVVLLRSLEMLAQTQRILSISSSNVAIGTTHPSIAARLANIDQQAFLWPTAAEGLRHFRRAYDNMMQVVWDEIRPQFERMAGRRQ